MTHLQEAFLSELKSNRRLTVPEYSALYNKHSKLAIQQEENKGVSEKQAKAMGNYYTVSVLSDFINNENILSRILAFNDSTKH